MGSGATSGLGSAVSSKPVGNVYNVNIGGGKKSKISHDDTSVNSLSKKEVRTSQ